LNNLRKDEVYIVGGGSSLKDFDFYQLKDKDTIAVNMSSLDVPSPTYCITADSGTFRKIQEGYFKEVKTTWVLVTNPNHCTMQWQYGRFINIKNNYVYDLFAVNMVIKNAGVDGIGFTFDDFRTGYNSGFCALQLAVLLGYKKIYLLGIDLTQGIDCHYHNRYHGRKIDTESFDRYYNNFVIALKILKRKTDIEVVSCSKISRLNGIIPFAPFGEKIKENISEIVEVHPLLKLQDTDCKKRLSILICSLKNRANQLNSILDNLQKQKTDDIEILVEVDEGKITTGAKRNLLLKRAKGDYIAFIDDDDKVSDDYISKILTAIETNPDCCGIEGLVTFLKRRISKTFKHSIQYDSWFEKNNMYHRCPNHLNPVKRELALQIGFQDISTGEDKDYSLRLKPLLKTEERIKGILYYYITR